MFRKLMSFTLAFSALLSIGTTGSTRTLRCTGRFPETSLSFILVNITVTAHPAHGCELLMRGVREFHREISEKGYRYMRPGLDTTEWGTLETGAIDPFGNMIRFCERIDTQETPSSTGV